jgi:hypothetical protein
VETAQGSAPGQSLRTLAKVLVLLCVATALFAKEKDETKYSLKAWTDPFWIGGTTRLTVTNRENEFRSETLTQLEIGHGWDTGVVLSAFVPVVYSDNAGGNLESPRIGGGLVFRPEIDGTFRLWGDYLDYFALGTGVGLPIQSDPALQNSDSATWLILLKALGRADWGWGALEVTFSDYATFPKSFSAANGNHFYFDGTNFIRTNVRLLYYPPRYPGFAPFADWTEDAPRHTQSNLDQFGRDFLLVQNSVMRSRHATFGAQLAPFNAALVIELGLQTFLFTDIGPLARWATTGTVRWVF